MAHRPGMDIGKLLQGIEEMIFDVVCLAVLLPKTFFCLALFPGRVPEFQPGADRPAEEVK